MTNKLNPVFKYLFRLLVLLFFIICSGVIVNEVAGLKMAATELILLSFTFSFVSAIALTVFFIGQSKEKTSQHFYSFVAISLKFLLEMVIALFWFITAKKTAIPYILLFFVLYLTFTMFSIWVILNTLKKKSL